MAGSRLGDGGTASKEPPSESDDDEGEEEVQSRLSGLLESAAVLFSPLDVTPSEDRFPATDGDGAEETGAIAALLTADSFVGGDRGRPLE